MAKPATKPKAEQLPDKSKSPQPGDNSVSPEQLKTFYRDMLLIRRFGRGHRPAVHALHGVAPGGRGAAAASTRTRPATNASTTAAARAGTTARVRTIPSRHACYCPIDGHRSHVVAANE